VEYSDAFRGSTVLDNGAVAFIRRFSMKPSYAVNDNHIGRQISQTRQVWQPCLWRDLIDEDARQITLNVTGFFGILAEWSQSEKFAADNDVAAAATPNDGEARHES